MRETIVLRISFDILNEVCIENIKKMLSAEGYFDFYETSDVAALTICHLSDILLRRTLVCRKKIKEDEINHIHLVGESLTLESNGITKVIDRSYTVESRKWHQKLIPDTIIVAATALGIILAAEITHPEALTLGEELLLFALPTGLDALYELKR